MDIAHSRDAWIAGELASALRVDLGGRAEGVQLLVRGGVVTLTGCIGTAWERTAVAAWAWRMPGVSRVLNLLEVRPDPWTPLAASLPGSGTTCEEFAEEV